MRYVDIVLCRVLFSRRVCRLRKEVIYQAIWAENASFDQIRVSPTMFSDHMPAVIFRAMKMVRCLGKLLVSLNMLIVLICCIYLADI